jgi:menaquinone-dependent protoporphyrinogen IX oxidase
MKIEYVHASKYGNGREVAEEFAQLMRARDVDVAIDHIRQVKPAELPAADLYVFSAPGRFGKPIRSMRRFLGKVQLPPGTRCAVFTTEIEPKPDKKTGKMPTAEELAKWQHVRPIMHELLQAKGLDEVGEGVCYVTGLRGPLAEGWQGRVEAFASTLPIEATT